MKKKESLKQKMYNLIELYSNGIFTIEEAINNFELLIKEYSDHKRPKKDSNVTVLIW